MIKKNRWRLLFSSLVILLPILFGLIVWKKLPEQMVTHWGTDGSADGWSNRGFAVFALPIFIFIAHWFCVFCTSKDQKNKNQSSKVFGMVLWICPITSLFANGMIYTAAFGKEIDLYFITSMLIGLIFVVMGNYLPKCRQNSTIGVKVKWALESEENWNATHRFCGKIWAIGGLAILFCSFLPEAFLIYALPIWLIVLSILPIVYSYYYHKIKQ